MVCEEQDKNTCHRHNVGFRLDSPLRTHQTVSSVFYVSLSKLNKLFSLVWELVRQQNYQTYSFDFFCLQRHRITHLSLFDVLRKELTFDGIFNANSAGSTLRRRHIGTARQAPNGNEHICM